MKSRGSALVDYILPTALIGVVVGLSLWALTDSNILLSFITNSINGQMQNGVLVVDNNYSTTSIPTNTSTSSADAAPTTPLSSIIPPGTYDKATGTINLGTFTLTGLPENFSDFTETAGASGGTDKLASLIYQLANQVEQNGDIAQAEEIRKLATMGHNIASIQKQLEQKTLTCNGDMTCIWETTQEELTTFDAYDTRYTDVPQYLKGINVGMIGNTRLQKFNEPDKYNDNLRKNHPAAHFVETYDQLMADATLSPEAKGIIKELTWSIGMIGEEFEENFLVVLEGRTVDSGEKYIEDPLTAESVVVPVENNSLETITSFKSSTITNLDSALICASGQYTDSGTKCH